MDLTTHLKHEYVQRKKRNSKYSLRAFAKSLDVDQSLLSKILRGVRQPSAEVRLKIGLRLGLSTANLAAPQSTRGKAPVYRSIAADALQILSHWEHFAILELVKTKSFRPDFTWIARRLSLSEIEVEVAVKRLEAFGFLKLSKPKWLLTTPNNAWTDFSHTNEGRRFLQKKLLEMAAESIDRVDFKARENASLTVQCSPRLLPVIKAKFDQFCEQIDQYIEENGPHDHVYQMVLGFFPLTEGEIE